MRDRRTRDRRKKGVPWGLLIKNSDGIDSVTVIVLVQHFNRIIQRTLSKFKKKHNLLKDTVFPTSHRQCVTDWFD